VSILFTLERVMSSSNLAIAPDLYYLHRRDPRTPLEESITALNDLKKAGKCKYIGISECSAQTLRDACKSGCSFSLEHASALMCS
jgi:aryl-alcohol dehydrogenase-like predicted oxidoreductase